MTATAPMAGENLGARYCGAVTLDGTTCKQVVGVNGSGRCIWHDPARAAEATEVRRKGRIANARTPSPDDVPPPPGPDTLAQVIAWHTWTAGGLARGQLDKATATSLTYCLMQLRAALVSRDLEREVEELRAQVATLRQKRAG